MADGERIVLRLAGVPQLRLGGQVLAAGTRKALALAVMATLEPRLRRGRAADLLWPEADPATARRNLRRDLFRLRQAGLDLGHEGGETLALADADIDWPRPSTLRPAWLDGLDEVAGVEFAHWVDAMREQLQRRWIEALAADARALERGSRPAEALAAWRALLADGAAGPGHAEAVAAIARLAPEEAAASAAQQQPPPPVPAPGAGPLAVPFSGREAELAEVRRALARGVLVLLDGAPGAGKSRLALQALAARGAPLVMRCRPEDVAAPYASALRGLQAARDAADDGLVPPWARRELAALVPEWQGRGAPGELPEAPRLRRAYRAALRALIAGSFDGIVIDDWQWADEPSRELWEPEAGVAGVPCLVVHRSGELPPEALQRRRRWIDTGLAAAVTLRPMPAAEARALLEALLPLLPPRAGGGPGALEAIVERCAGNPLFLIESLRHGAPVSARPGPEAASSEMPPGVRETIVARSRALGPAVRRVLEAASLIGDECVPRLLAVALGIDVLAVAQALEHAAAAELLLTDARGRHRFAHELYAQAIAQSLSPVRREALHGQLADALAQRGAEPGRVAWHHDRAGHAAEAVPWHLEAARVALGRRAWHEAEQAAAAALAAAPGAVQRVEARLLIARAQVSRSEPLAAESTLEAGLRDAALAGPGPVADLCLARAQLWASTSRAPQALEELDGLAVDPALDDRRRHRMLELRAMSLSYMGRHGEALPLLEQLLAALPPSEPQQRLRVLDLLARGAYWAGRVDAAQRHVEQALALARALDDEVSIARGLFRLGAMERERGGAERADELLRESAAVARRAGHLELLRSALSTLATTRLDRLQLDEAEALLAEGEQAAPFWETPDLEDVYDERRFRLCYLRGDLPAAEQVIERSLARHRGGHLHSHLGSLAQATRLALAMERPARARALQAEARALHAASGADSLHGQELDALEVELLCAEHRADEACAMAGRWLAAPLRRRVEEHARVLAAAAGAAIELGDHGRAAAWLAQAAALPVVAYEIEALLLMARLRLAAARGEPDPAALADARAWLGRGALPSLERALLVRLLPPGGP